MDTGSNCSHSAYWTTIYNNCMACRAEMAEKECERLKSLVLAERQAAMEEAAKIVEDKTKLAIAAEQRYRENHGTEELNGIRMSERVECGLTSLGLYIIEAIQQAQASRDESNAVS